MKIRGWESLHQVLLHLGKKILLNKDREFFHHQSVFYTKITSSSLPSQTCAKKQPNIFVHTLHCQQNLHFAKAKIFTQKS